MTDEKAAFLIGTTQKLIDGLWHGDSSMLMEHINDDFILVDPNHDLFLNGKDKLNVVLTQVINQSEKTSITNKKFILAQNCGNACTVIGDYSLTLTINGMPRVIRQNCVFTWELNDSGDPLLKHIGISSPLSVTSHCFGENIRPSEGPAREPAPPKSGRMVITDLNECTRFVHRSDILYATSDGRNTLIRCANDDINARISISSFLKEAGSGFISIHRCYAVNTEHIMMIKPYAVILSDGSELPVPVKRYAEIKQMLNSMLGDPALM